MNTTVDLSSMDFIYESSYWPFLHFFNPFILMVCGIYSLEYFINFKNKKHIRIFFAFIVLVIALWWEAIERGICTIGDIYSKPSWQYWCETPQDSEIGDFTQDTLGVLLGYVVLQFSNYTPLVYEFWFSIIMVAASLFTMLQSVIGFHVFAYGGIIMTVIGIVGIGILFFLTGIGYLIVKKSNGHTYYWGMILWILISCSLIAFLTIYFNFPTYFILFPYELFLFFLCYIIYVIFV
jgi:hypothetical protein